MKMMILALGSNLGDKVANLTNAITCVRQHFTIAEISRVYQSVPVGFLDQPDFYNLVMACDPSSSSPLECLEILQKIGNDLGRTRIIPQGPRIIDIDLLFFDTMKIHTPELVIPHPQWHLRSFTVYPLLELSAYNKNRSIYTLQSLPSRQGLLPVGYI